MVNGLLEIKQAVDHQRRFRILEPKACVNIRKFRINRKKTRRGKRHKNQAIPRSVKFSNLIMVKLNMDTRIKRPQRNIRITTLNAHLVKNKDQLITDYILNTKANYTVITETWLRDTDNIWTEGSDLNQNRLQIWKQNRTGGIGGGLALVTPGEYISDHLAVEANILVSKDIVQKDITIRKLKNMDKTKFIKDLNLEEFPETDNINTLVNTLEQKMKEILDNNAPENSQRITVRPKNPWFSDDLREQKRLIR